MYREALEKREIEERENEIYLEVGEPFGELPDGVMGIEERGQYMLFNYLSGVWNEHAGRSSRGDMLLSYVMALDEWEKVTKMIFEKYDEETANGVEQKVRVKDPVLYTKWTMRATNYWNAKNLGKHIDAFEQVLLGGVEKEKLLKNAIWDDAMHAEDKKYRMANRREYTKISGMQNQNNQVVFNVYNRGGGREKAKAIKEELGIDKFDLSEVIGDE